MSSLLGTHVLVEYVALLPEGLRFNFGPDTIHPDLDFSFFPSLSSSSQRQSR